MLGSAAAMVNRDGLTVSLDHIRFEDVIRDAGVSRSAAYRHWPYKDLFFSDLLKDLARAATPAAVAAEGATTELLRRVALQHVNWLETAELRRQLGLELIRQGALADFELIYGSTEWRTYLALHATFLSLADGDLRDAVQMALAQSDQVFITRIATAWAYVAELLGYRLRTEADVTFETLARLLSATMRGLVIMALSTPEIARRRMQASPFGSTTAEWSLAAMGIASLAGALLEPDPTIEWNNERIANVHAALKTESGSAGRLRAAPPRSGSTPDHDE
jgi:AcrR family transcriptional regulator